MKTSGRFLIIVIVILSFCLGQESYIDSSKIKNPDMAWKLSIVPGLGQAYNGKWAKAFFFLGSEYFAVTKFRDYHQRHKVANRNTYAWWIIGLYVMGLLDAYVDAQLSTFPVKVESDMKIVPEEKENTGEESSKTDDQSNGSKR